MWKSRYEESPDTDREVLVFYYLGDTSHYGIGRYIANHVWDEQWIIDVYGDIESRQDPGEVVYWMDIPKLPE